MSTTNTVVGLFSSRSDANLGMTRLLMVGFQPEEIGLLEQADQPVGEGSFVRQVLAGRTLVSAEVADPQRGTVAAAVLHDSNAIEVASPVPGHLGLPVRHPAFSEEAA